MDDGLLLSRAAAGDLESFGQLYDWYFPRVYDFTYRVVLDPTRAAELTAAVFDQALRGIASVPRDQSFRTWLFGLAYRAALASGAASVPQPPPEDVEAFGAFDAPDPARIAETSMVEVEPERAALAWEAACALSRADRAFLDLHLRQELGSSEIAPIVGANPRQAATIVTRMQAAARDVMALYIVARSSDCDALRAAIGPAGLDPYTQEARSAVSDHVARCAACQGVRRAVPDPVEVYSYFAPVDAPMSLKGDIWVQLAETWATGAVPVASTWRYAAAGAAAAGGAGGGGGAPIVLGGDGGADRRQMLWFAAAAAGLLLFAFIFGAVLVRAIGGGDDGSSAAGATGGTATPEAPASATAGTSSTPGVAVQTPTANLTPSVTPTPAETPTEVPPTAAPPTNTPPPTNTVVVPTVPRPTATATRPATPTPILPRG